MTRSNKSPIAKGTQADKDAWAILCSRLFHAIQEPHAAVWNSLIEDLRPLLLPLRRGERVVFIKTPEWERRCIMRRDPREAEVLSPALTYFAQQNHAELVVTIELADDIPGSDPYAQITGETRFARMVLDVKVTDGPIVDLIEESATIRNETPETKYVLSVPDPRTNASWKPLADELMRQQFERFVKEFQDVRGRGSVAPASTRTM